MLVVGRDAWAHSCICYADFTAVVFDWFKKKNGV